MNKLTKTIILVGAALFIWIGLIFLNEITPLIFAWSIIIAPTVLLVSIFWDNDRSNKELNAKGGQVTPDKVKQKGNLLIYFISFLLFVCLIIMFIRLETFITDTNNSLKENRELIDYYRDSIIEINDNLSVLEEELDETGKRRVEERKMRRWKSTIFP
ncbi:MAG: hypothetical protein HQ568_11110 [Calditrichaeota bacterium]|nr:hypothetical protein [Calditrichota bacterium]